ncbi:class I SAM-dependent methyltransferase [Pararhizobium sp. BT-229]|uniref:class I SAM-dependent methyltransferase n=1 Tax=Pararhizobium sp. BT-229 TaxID=2986923 RepID=UPI0021F7DA49|nr:class I SAM-dependent methyltransferase [Pararhizobium sp. BT-229]MCV9963062.1 class I SAM-dependent methyltransferase [Pararhizobium sp. BT-229]
MSDITSEGAADIPPENPAEKKIAAFDANFAKWLEKNPGGQFSKFSTEAIRKSLEKGTAHATLGPTLKSGTDWREAGVTGAKRIYDRCQIDHEAKLCDYGCGSLRVGVHIIERQAAGCYFGIDVSQYLVDTGEQLVGEELVREKRPVLGTIDDKLDEVIAAGIDVAFSYNVASHVHPDEQDNFISNLKAICHKPGSQLLLHVLTCHEPMRVQQSGWAWKRSQYLDWLAPLRLVDETLLSQVYKNDIKFEGWLMTFERPKDTLFYPLQLAWRRWRRRHFKRLHVKTATVRPSATKPE